MSEPTKRTRKAAAPVVEEKKAPVCKGHHQLHMCYNCTDEHCKERGYFKMHRCKGFFFWIVAMASMLIMLIGVIAIFLSARIIDGNWSDGRLPMILLTIFASVTMTLLIIGATLDFKHRIGDAVYE